MAETESRERGLGLRSAIVDSIAIAFIIFVALPLEPLTVVLLGLFGVAFFTQRGDRTRSLLMFAGALCSLIVANLANSLLRKESAYYFVCPAISTSCLYSSSHKMFSEDVRVVPIISPFRYEFERFIQSDRSNSYFLSKTSSGGISFFTAPLEDLIFTGQRAMVGYNYVDINIVSTSAAISFRTGNVEVGPRQSSVILAKATSSSAPGLFAVAIDSENPTESARRAAFSNEFIAKFSAGDVSGVTAELWREAHSTNQAEDYARYAIFALREADSHAGIDIANYQFQFFVQDVSDLIQLGSGRPLNENWLTSYMLNLPRSVCRHLAGERWITGVDDGRSWYPDFQKCSAHTTNAESAIAGNLAQSIRIGAGAISQFPKNYEDKLWSLMVFSLGTQGGRDFKTDQKILRSVMKGDSKAGGSAVDRLPHTTRLKLAWNLSQMAELGTWNRYALLAEAPVAGADNAESCLPRTVLTGQDFFSLPQETIGGPAFEKALAILLPNTEKSIFRRKVARAETSAARFYDVAGKAGVICFSEIIGVPEKDASARALFGANLNSILWRELFEIRRGRRLTLQFLVNEIRPRDRNFAREEYRVDLYWLLQKMAREYDHANGSAEFVGSDAWKNACNYVDTVTETYTNSQETDGQLAPHFKRALDNALLVLNKLCGRSEGDQFRSALEIGARNWMWIIVSPDRWPGAIDQTDPLPPGNGTAVQENMTGA